MLYLDFHSIITKGELLIIQGVKKKGGSEELKQWLSSDVILTYKLI